MFSCIVTTFLCTDFTIILFMTPFWPLFSCFCLPSFPLKILISEGFSSCRVERQYPTLCHFPGIICSLTFYLLVNSYYSLLTLDSITFSVLELSHCHNQHHHYHYHCHFHHCHYQECCIKLTLIINQNNCLSHFYIYHLLLPLL